MKLHSHRIDYHLKVSGNHSGRPWLLLLHGFMGSGKAFSHLTEPLSGFCNPVTVDLAGHGKSGGSDRPERYHTHEQIRDMVSILERINVHPLFLHGYSMGGRLALQLAIKHPRLFRGIILESTTPGLPTMQQRQERQRLDEERARAIETDYHGFLDSWQKEPLLAPRPAGTATSAILHEHYLRIMRRQNPAWMAACLRGFGTGTMPSVWSRLHETGHRVLLLSGEHDRKFCKIHQQMEQQLPSATGQVIPGAGHRVHLDRPNEFLNRLKPFIQTTDS